MPDTSQQFDQIISLCRNIFIDKMKDYGPSWRMFRPRSVTDQLFIKAKRIRSIETTGTTLVGDGVEGEFKAIVNYGIIALIQLELGYADTVDIDRSKSLELYDKYVRETKNLLHAKNHDYGEAWRGMRMESFTDMILTKIYRVKSIESNNGQTNVSEGIDANYYDIINYAVFGLIKIYEQNN
ncbi:MAG: DUF1599 domain-containing protein [Paludibacter sp.]|jgi:hypothetical protein|nr:DUF1599 domain-containing protein [Paludibacter sp.]